METLYHDDGRKSEERCSECMRSYLNRRSRKAGPWGTNPKWLRCNESLGIGTSKRICIQCSSKNCAEDNNDTNTSCDESFESDVGENDEKRSCLLRLRIRFPQPCQKDYVNSVGSPCSESDQRHNRDPCLLRLRIRPARTQVSSSLNTPKERYKYIEVGQDNECGENDVGKASKGPERSHNLEQLVEGDKERSGHWNRIRIHIHDNINPSKIHADEKVKTSFPIRRSAYEGEQSSGSSGCARTEYSHMRGERSRVSKDRASMPERSGGLFITYDSRRKRTDPQLLDLFVSKSRIHGQGVFTRNAIKKGLIILEFFGEIIRESVSDVRERRYLEAGMQSFYVFSLVGRGRQADRFCLDSTRKGGLGRFINHCCLPNSEAEVRGRGIMIRTIRDVDYGEEITLDYNMREGKDKCSCGAENCSGVLGGMG